MLKWLTKKVYSSLSEVLGAVYKELDSLQPVDTDTVKWTKSLNGMKAHAVVQSSPVAMNQVQEDSVQAEYRGWFKVSIVGEVLRVYNGALPEDNNAGQIQMGITTHNIPVQEFPIVDGYICVSVTYDELTGYSYGCYQGVDFTATDSVWYYPVAQVVGNAITQIHQQGIPTVLGRWL